MAEIWVLAYCKRFLYIKSVLDRFETMRSEFGAHVLPREEVTEPQKCELPPLAAILWPKTQSPGTEAPK